ncbi:MAG TPA: c-type cytochrome [Longimicrobium sp.]|nr:c-type cytochrome [Longimicrobium sp.]
MRIQVVAAAMLLLAGVVGCGGEDAGGGTSAPRSSDGSRSAPADARAPGADLYATGCAPCHGGRGEGTQLAPALSDSARAVDRVVQVVQSGVATAQPPHVPMPARGDGTWSDAQVRTVAEYVHSLAR